MTGPPEQIGDRALPSKRWPTDDFGASLTARFEEQARLRPGALAVRTNLESLTYGELNARANRIAHCVLAANPVHSRPVPLLVSQGAWQIASLLGVLKAGGFYVPLDGSWRGALLAEVLSELNASVLLTDHALESLACSLAKAGSAVHNVEEIDPATADHNPGIEVAPDDLAYIFYTSGTTGRAKGVADTHRNVLHNVMRYTRSLHLTESDRLSLLQHPSFSGSVSNVFGALLNGGSVHPMDVRSEGAAAIASWLYENRITIYHSVPSLFRVVAQEGLTFPELRLIRLEGDQAHWRDVELFQKHFQGDCILVNGMGATECGLIRQFFVENDTRPTTPTVPVGYAVDGMEVLILDESGAECAPSPQHPAVGEIAVRSRYLATGYWQRPDLTAARFSDAQDGSGLRTYHTGDLGRLYHDGCLEWLGRTDHLVKLRGQWVDIRSTEEIIRQHSGIGDAAVAPYTDGQGETRLGCYYTVARENPSSASELRTSLQRQLPAHAMPAAFILLEELPLNIHGKLDRQALPAPDGSQHVLDTSFEAPRTATQARLCQIWAELLGISPVGVHETFFDLGGHSLLVARLIQRMRSELGTDVSLAEVLTHPTIAGLADYVDGNSTDSPPPTAPQVRSLLPLRSAGVSTPLFFLPGGGGGESEYANAYLELIHFLGDDQPVYGFVARGQRDETPPHDAVEQMAADYVAELRTIQPDGPFLLGGECIGGRVAYEMARQLVNAGETVALLALVNAAFYRQDEIDTLDPGFRTRRAWHRNVTSRLRQFRRLPIRQWPQRLRILIANASVVFVPVTARQRRARVIRSNRWHYINVLHEYKPPAYGGRTVLLMTADRQRHSHAWRERLTGKVSVEVIPGRYENYLRDHAAEVASALRRHIDAVRSEP